MSTNEYNAMKATAIETRKKTYKKKQTPRETNKQKYSGWGHLPNEGDWALAE